MPQRHSSLVAAAVAACLFASFSRADLLDTKPSGAVNDFASVLSGQTRGSLEALATALQEKTGVSCVLVTVPTLGGADIDETATSLFEKWGIGKKGVDEGVLVLLSVNDRMIRIETGYGAEGYLTDAQSNRIIEAITPALSQKRWDEACTDAMAALSDLAARAHHVSLGDIAEIAAQPAAPAPRRAAGVNLFGLLFVASSLPGGILWLVRGTGSPLKMREVNDPAGGK